MTTLLLEPLHPDALAELEAFGRTVLASTPEDALALARSEPVAAIVTRGRGQVDEALIAACPELKVIARVGVGVDNVDVDAASRRGIRVVNAPGSTTLAVAEQTILLMLALVRGLVPMANAVKAEHWEVRRGYLGDELYGKTLGLIGMGAIAQRVAVLAQAFDMDVCYWNRMEKDVHYPYHTFVGLLAASDVLSLHVPLTPETRGLIGQDALKVVKHGAMLVNTARGGLIDAVAVRAALDDGTLGGYGTDVWHPEPPPPGDPLLHHKRVLALPHIAALTGPTFRRLSLRTVRNVLALLRGEAPEPDCIYNAEALAV